MLFKYNAQQWLNLDSIETVDDFGDRVSVTLKGGRTILVSDRDRFLAAIEPRPAAISREIAEALWRY